MAEWNKTIGSPIRWAGSKTKILSDLLLSFDCTKENYIEPFLGSGVVLLNVLNNRNKLNYKKFYVSDANNNLISFYKALKQNVGGLIRSIKRLEKKFNDKTTMDEKAQMYYEIRKLFNNSEKTNDDYFYFLMKVGFNGVYRENQSGEFNVPFGKKEKMICDENRMLETAKIIRPVLFYNEDWQDFLNRMKKMKKTSSAFIYCDPPYIPDDDAVYKKQMLYSKKTFLHEKFCERLLNLSNENCTVIVSMSDSKRANQIYSSDYFKKEEIKSLARSVNPNRKFHSKEVIYKII